jgi:poly(3-hydroxybutyrate) depolymerase
MWTTVDIAGKPADVLDGNRPRFAVLFLHDIDQKSLAGNAAFTAALQQQGLACVCPHGKRSWWLDRVCNEFDPTITPESHLLQNVVPFAQERWGLEPRRIAPLGIGMGGQGAIRLAFRHAKAFPVVAGIASSLDFYEVYDHYGPPLVEMYDSKEQCRQDTAILHLHPTDYPRHIFYCIDPDDRLWHRGNDRLHEKMGALGVTHEIEFTTRAGGHTWAYFEHMANRVAAFLRRALDEEARRLL